MRKIILIFAALCFFTLPAFPQWDGTSSPWTHGTGTQADPYQISSPQHLAYLADMVCAGVNDYNGKYFLLTQDISLSNLSWMPIGDSGHPFKGNFDGGGHMIDSMNITNTYTYSGLFGYIDNAIIRNLVLYGHYNDMTTLYSYAGGFIGACNGNCLLDNLINNCSIVHSFTNASGNCNVGGIVGFSMVSDTSNVLQIRNCKNQAPILITRTNTNTLNVVIGGILGQGGKFIIVRCSNRGNILLNSNYLNSAYCGGICGKTSNNASLHNNIKTCYNEAAISINSNSSSNQKYSAGILGYAQASSTVIKDCYNTGNIGNASYTYGISTGGICSVGASVYNSYNVGQLVGAYTYGVSNNSQNSYYKNDCGATGGGNSRTEAQMKSSSFPIILNTDSTVYVMDQENVNGGYPIFYYTITYDAVTDNADSIGSYGANINGHFTGPTDTVGFIYGRTSGNTTMTQVYITPSNNDCSYHLTNLVPNTQYRYAFFIKHGYTSQYIYGDTLTFTTYPLHNVTVNSNNAAWGNVSGNGTFEHGGQTILTATPNEHYQFAQWSDGNTSNPRAITVTSDTSFTVVFEVTSYTINAVVNNSSWGSVTGAGEYEYNTPFLLTAIPTTGHYFDHWLEESTQTMYFETYNPLTFTTTRNETYTAVFATTQYTVNVLSNNDTMGWVSGGGTYDYNQQVYIAAHPMGNYIFTQWSDGNTDAYRLITVTQNVTYTASFTDAIFNITATANNIAFGVVTGSGSYPRGSQVQLTAVPNEGYHFTQWNDGNTDNPRTITVDADAIYTAQFAAITYVVNVSSSNTAMGSAMGGGIFSYGQQTTIEATAMPHYRFVQWNDGVNSNPRIVTIFSDTTFIAEFEQLPQYTITVVSADETKGSVSGGGTFYGGEQTVISATATAGNVFDRWSDGNTEAIRTLTVTSDVTYTAYFSGIRCTVNVYSNDDQMGSVSGGGEYEQGSQAMVTATPANGCRFVRWNNGVETNPYTFTVYSNVNLIANFEHVTGVDEIEKLPFTIATRGSAITIYGTDNSSVHIHDILGRTIYTSKKYDGEWIDLRSSGVYLVSVDENKPIKIVIIN